MNTRRKLPYKQKKNPPVNNDAGQESEVQTQKKPNPPQEESIGFFKRFSPGDWINLVMAFLTLVSVILVKMTLDEMQTAREATYHPHIVMDTIQETAEWDSEGDLLWLKNYARSIETTQEKGDDGLIHGKMKIPMYYFHPSSFFNYSVVNVGEGASTETVFEWSEDNSSALNNYLCSLDAKYGEFFSGTDKNDIFECNYNLFLLDKEITTRLMYLEPEAKKTYSLDFPAQYSLLTGMIMKDYDKESSEQIPPLFLYIYYNDIQGKSFRETVMISINYGEKNLNNDGSGSVTYQYNPYLISIDEIKN